MTAQQTAQRARTLLFVPGDRPDRFDKAATSGADIVVIDLEDAVAPEHKADARGPAVERARDAERYAVRVNAIGTPWHDDDMAALSAVGSPFVIMLAKTEQADDVSRVLAAAPADSSVIALIETARGVLEAAEIALVTGVDRLALGTYDLAAELGIDPDHRPALAVARGTLVLASAVAGLPGPVDGVTGDVRDDELVATETSASAALGFNGKLCIHPAQVGPASSALAPSPGDVTWAERVLAATDHGAGSAVLVDGRMVDAPVVARARRIRAAAQATPAP